jgi:hypothetical protein
MKHAMTASLSATSICALACLAPGVAAANGSDANAQANQAQLHPWEANQTGWTPYGVAVGEVYPAAPGGFIGPNGYHQFGYEEVGPVAPGYGYDYGPTPAYGYPAPYRAPAYGYPAPAASYPAPSAGYPGPSYGYPAPAYGQPAYRAPAYGYRAPAAPAAGYPEPSYGYHEPTYGGSAPAYRHAAQYPAPSNGYPEPEYGYSQPGAGYPGSEYAYPPPADEQ